MTEAHASAAPAVKPVAQSSNARTAQPTVAATPDYKSVKHRVSVDGKDIEVDYDELRRGYGHQSAANQKFRQAAELEKAAKDRQAYAEGIIRRIDDPKGALQMLTEKYGPKQARDLFESYLIEQMEYEQLPESERRARELERKTKTLEEELKAEREEKETARKSQIEQRAYDDLNTEVAEALAKIGRKPTARLAIRVVDAMILRGSVMKEKVPAEKAVEFAREGIYADISEYLEDMTPEEAFKKLPKKFLQSLRQYEVNQVLDTKQQRRIKPAAKPADLAKPGEKLSFEEKFARLKDRVAKKA